MRSAVWVLDPQCTRERAAAIVDDLRKGDAHADLREASGVLTVVVADAADNLTPPPEVVRVGGFDLPLEHGLSRRTLLDHFATGLAVVVAGSVVGVSSLFAAPPARRRDGIEELEVASLAELRTTGFKTFRFGQEPGIVVLAGEKLHALSLVCTHLGCLVEWNVQRKQLVCPCHRAAFDLGGNVLEGPPPRPLPSFEVSVQGEQVLVRRPGRVS